MKSITYVIDKLEGQDTWYLWRDGEPIPLKTGSIEIVTEELRKREGSAHGS